MEDTSDEDSDNNEEGSDGMVLDEQNGDSVQDGFDQSDTDEAPFDEHFDEETEADSEMVVSFQILTDLLEENFIIMS